MMDGDHFKDDSAGPPLDPDHLKKEVDEAKTDRALRDLFGKLAQLESTA